MKIDDLKDRNVVIWGAGREGLAAAAMIHAKNPEQKIVIVDEGITPIKSDHTILYNPEEIAEALGQADVILKSPGVSLYHPLLEKEKERGVMITSLLNLWCHENPEAKIIAITGTKGKSTTCSLLQHVLSSLGKRSVLLGNIGTPVSEATQNDADYFVIEVSSFQSANFTGACEIGVIVSLFPEHLDWHGSEEQYFIDKANLLTYSKHRIVEKTVAERLHNIDVETFDDSLTETGNHYLDRLYNRGNVNAVLVIIDKLGLDHTAALGAMHNFAGLPHRQQELDELNGILYVDDSISTTPQSTIAAIETYKDRNITLIAGGRDRGIDLTLLIDKIVAEKIRAVVCLGENGTAIHSALQKRGYRNSFKTNTMQDAVAVAYAHTQRGGVILLSPAASSYDMFKNYIDRANAFKNAINPDG